MVDILDFSKFDGKGLIELYGELLAEMRNRGLIRSKNVVGDLGEYIVIDHYTRTKGLPKLQFAPPSTKNIDAISVDGDRYSIKCTTANTTGVFYGISKGAKFEDVKQVFEYLVIIQLDDKYRTELILEVDWKTFFEFKHWHSRMNAYNIIVTNKLIEASRVIYKKEDE